MRRVLTLGLYGLASIGLMAQDLVLGDVRLAKNIIVMIGDGTGLAQWWAAQAARPDSALAVFRMSDALGLSMTSSASNFITDSGAGATAISIGEKTQNRMIGVGPDSMARETLLEFYKKQGKSTGIVVTCGLTHATPAAFYAHVPSRYMDKEIAEHFYQGSVDIAIGGDYPLYSEKSLKKAGYSVALGLDEIQETSCPRFVGFYSKDKEVPSISKGRGDFLTASTQKALTVLNQNDSAGFFMLVEGSQIDWGGHANDLKYTVEEALDFDRCIEAVLNFAREDGQTLVIITADHETGGLSLVNYNTDSTSAVGAWSTHEHTGIPVPVFASGPGSSLFIGSYQNSEIYYKIKAASGFLTEEPKPQVPFDPSVHRGGIH
jgi:alkaline phosphatase